MALTEQILRKARPLERAFKLSDGGGLFVLIHPSGSKYWRWRYQWHGKEKTLALGVYPEVSLGDARGFAESARTQAAAGVDPSDTKRRARAEAQDSASNHFSAVAEEWLVRQRHRWTVAHAQKVRASLSADVLPMIGHLPVDTLSARAILQDVLRPIENRGAYETAFRVAQRVSAVLRYAVATDRCSDNPAAALKGALTAPKRGRHAALDAAEVPALNSKLEPRFTEVTRDALHLLQLTFVRTSELREARWPEFNLDGPQPLWRIPAERMKMKEEHLVPLARQAVAILRRLKAAASSEWVLPSPRADRNAPLSPNTMRHALYRLGYKGQATGHGFRATASTALNEQGFRSDVIERQLAHSERNKVRAAYNRAEYMDERRHMMQAWADHLDALKVIAASQE